MGTTENIARHSRNRKEEAERISLITRIWEEEKKDNPRPRITRITRMSNILFIIPTKAGVHAITMSYIVRFLKTTTRFQDFER